MVVRANVLISGFILVDETGTPRDSADLPVVELLVELDHVLICLCPLPVNLLILLVELVAVLVPFVVKLIHCCFVVPVLVCVKVSAAIRLGSEIILIKIVTRLTPAVKTVHI